MTAMTGPGTELHAILGELGIKPKAGCGCAQWAAWMNRVGTEGCRQHHAAIVQHLHEQADLGSVIMAIGHAITSGLAWKLSVSDPFGSIVRLAIERAEGKSVR
jgi:hypothetical protein